MLLNTQKFKIGNSNAVKFNYRPLLHSWFDEYLTANGDTDPITGHVHIPSYITQESFYELFRQFCFMEDLRETDIPSFFSFTHYFKSHFGHVHFLKHTRLGRCTFCLMFHEKRLHCTTDQELLDLKVLFLL